MEELLAIFCDVDDFCRDYEEYCQHHLLMDKSQIIPKTSMSLSEIMTIVIYFHFEQNIQLVTRLRSNMKNKLMAFSDRLLLRKRSVIESVNDFLKNICQIEHSRHRSIDNFFVNLLAVLVAYSFIPKKPSLNIPKLPVSV